MANTVAYNNGSNPVGSIKKGVVSINVDNSLITSGLTWRNGIEFTNQYIIYSDTYTQGIDTQQNAKPCAWSCDYNDTALRDLINSLPALIGQPKYSTLADAVAWLEGQGKYFIVNQNYPEIVTSGCVLNVDATMTGSYPNVGTTWYDLTNTKNGALTNGPTWVNSGTTSYFNFDGSDDKVLFNANNFPQTYTKTALFYARDTSTRNILSSSSPVDHAFWLTSGNLAAGHNGSYSTVSTPISTNRWYFGTVTYSNSTNAMELFLNGVSKSTNNASSIGSGGDYKIGEHSSNQSFNGLIGHVNLYSRVLSQSEILQNYYRGNIVTSGLTLALDAGNLVSYGGAGTTWYDMTANGNNVTLMNSVGYSGGTVPAMIMDGTDDYMVKTNVTGIPNLESNFTIDTFVKPTATNYGNIVVLANSTFNLECQLLYQTNRVVVTKYGGNILVSATSNSVPLNTWNHIVYRQENNTGSIYINGLLNATSSIVPQSATTANILLGSYANSGGYEPFGGQYSNVRIYDRALSATEIQQNFNTYRRRYGI